VGPGTWRRLGWRARTGLCGAWPSQERALGHRQASQTGPRAGQGARRLCLRACPRQAEARQRLGKARLGEHAGQARVGGVALGLGGEWAARARWATGRWLGAGVSPQRALGHARGRPREVDFPFYYFFLRFLFLFPAINFINYNELHIKRIHTKAKHHTKTNIFPRDASIIIPLGFY
jgi:hypothetical protein